MREAWLPSIASFILHFFSISTVIAKLRCQESSMTATVDFYRFRQIPIWLQTMPKMFGYAFNPVSFWFCKKQSCLDAVLCEVNNTFGERHFYWLCPAKGIHSEQWLKAQKVFHVSPFFPVEGYYQFRFRLTGQKNHIDINYFGDDNDLRLVTWVAGELAPIEQASFIRLFVKYGWMTLLVILRIHLQAVYLFIKRARFYRKPLPPAKGITT